MAIPAYLWLKDDGGTEVKGSVDVHNREGSIEVLSFTHGLHIPTDCSTGKLTGTRIHGAFTFEYCPISRISGLNRRFFCDKLLACTPEQALIEF